MGDETSAGEGLQRIAEHCWIGTMPLRGLSALLFLGGILYALPSGNWGLGAIAFGLGAALCFALVQGKCVLGLWLSVHCRSTPLANPR